MALKYLAGERIIGTAAERAAMTTSASAQTNTGWKILGRYDHGSSATPPTITAKDNLMVFIFTKRANSSPNSNILLKFNDDANGNYSYRQKLQNTESRATTAEEGETDGIPINANGKNECFTIMRIRNIAGKEKYVHGQTSGGTASGASEANASTEFWGKWATTSGQITKITIHTTTSSDNWQSGGECVILGMDDDEADSGTNAFQELTKVVLGSNNTHCDTTNSGWTAKKYMFYMFVGNFGTNSANGYLEFNGVDSGGKYSVRREHNGDAYGSQTSQNSIFITQNGNSTDQPVLITGYIHNTTREHHVISHSVFTVGSGEDTEVQRYETMAKWADTSLINRINIRRGSSYVWEGGKTELRVWGFD